MHYPCPCVCTHAPHAVFVLFLHLCRSRAVTVRLLSRVSTLPLLLFVSSYWGSSIPFSHNYNSQLSLLCFVQVLSQYSLPSSLRKGHSKGHTCSVHDRTSVRVLVLMRAELVLASHTQRRSSYSRVTRKGGARTRESHARVELVTREGTRACVTCTRVYAPTNSRVTRASVLT